MRLPAPVTAAHLVDYRYFDHYGVIATDNGNNHLGDLNRNRYGPHIDSPFRCRPVCCRTVLSFSRTLALHNDQAAILRLVHQVENSCCGLKPLHARLRFPFRIWDGESRKQTLDERVDRTVRFSLRSMLPALAAGLY